MKNNPNTSLTKRALDGCLRLLPPSARVRAGFFAHHHRLPNLRNATSFSEKIQIRKLTDRSPLLPRCADKVLAKLYVSGILGERWVIPALWTGRRLPEFPERTWPVPYVLKPNNSSGKNRFVFRGDHEDQEAMDRAALEWELAPAHGTHVAEWLYEQIEFQLLVEPFIGSDQKLPTDYKFFVFHGEPRFIQVDIDRGVLHRRSFFDSEWRQQKFSLHYPMAEGEIAPPKSLGEMLAACRLLATGMDFVRIDFYEKDDQPLFGEMTFYPGSGFERFTPESADALFGKLW